MSQSETVTSQYKIETEHVEHDEGDFAKVTITFQNGEVIEETFTSFFDSPSESAREFLEVVGGERCPCGHLTENHHDPEPFELEGFVAVTGKCKICPPSNPCNGQLEFATGFDD